MSSDYIVDKILSILEEEKSSLSSLDLAKQLDVDHQRIVGAIKSISALASSASVEEFLDIEQKELKTFQLTEEGHLIVDNGSHEARIYNEAAKYREQGIAQPALLACITDQAMAKVGFSKAMKNGWIKIDKSQNKIFPVVTQIKDEVREDLRQVILSPDALSTETIKEYKKRKLLVDNNIKYLVIKRGPGFTLTLERPETDLTTDLLLSGDWKDRKFKEYNFNALGMPVERGHLHPLLKVREQFRQIFLEMGFAEMPTNNFVESSFWNFDTLIVPQAHPARDSQDTFFISVPEYSRQVEDRDLVDRVRFAHQGTVDGSWPTGYRYNWKEDESSRNVLRTHTTAVTARMLYKLAQEYKQSKETRFKPAKLFSIDRVFRNETLDATHLAEFNQVEGVVVDEGLTLGDLMGVLEAFFKKLGIGQLRFKPAYNPYTEPSMEVFSYHSGLKKWVEVGNSGLFRPEMLTALGLPENVSAIAWGLSLERPTMIKYKIDNIRELVGHKVNLEMVQANPICLF